MSNLFYLFVSLVPVSAQLIRNKKTQIKQNSIPMFCVPPAV